MCERKPKLTLYEKAAKIRRRRCIVSVCAASLFLLLSVCIVWLSLSGGFDGLFAPAAAMPSDGEVLVEFIDVGQGDCALIVDGDTVLLVDAGTPDSFAAISAALRSRDINEIDYFLITHPHTDHIGSARAVLESFTVHNVIASAIPLSLVPDTATASALYYCIAQQNVKYTTFSAGDTLALENSTLEFLSPFNDMDYPGLNNRSLVFRYVYGDTAFLFCADAELEAEEEILYTGYNLSSNVIKIAHHGSRYSSTQPLLNAASAQWAVISCGSGNSYGYPHEQTLERIAASGAMVLRTDLLGNICFFSNGKTVRLAN